MNPRSHPLPNEIQSRIIRFTELVPCKTAFIDAKTPGSDEKENFCLIGGGVAENPDQRVHINISHGFDIGGARQPKGCKNSHHSHDTAEVFYVHHGSWKFSWGQDGGDGEIILNTGDTISIPTQVFRGFENVGPDDGFLYAILGLNRNGSAGKVTWAPYVHEQAKSYGLVLLDNGQLIDTSIGTPVPPGAVAVKPLSNTDLKKFRRLSDSQMNDCVARLDESLNIGGLSQQNSVSEYAIIGNGNSKEHIGAGKMAWEHDFQVRRLHLQPDAEVLLHTRAEEEVLFVHSGTLDVTVPDHLIRLAKGDLFTVPVGMPRQFKNTTGKITDVIIVRRGNHPDSATFETN